MYCTACGKELHNDAVVCMTCGVGTDNMKGVGINDTGSAGWVVLGFFVPIVALIFYLVWKDEKPKTAHALAKGGIGYLIYLGVVICMYFFIITFALSTGILTELPGF